MFASCVKRINSLNILAFLAVSPWLLGMVFGGYVVFFYSLAAYAADGEPNVRGVIFGARDSCTGINTLQSVVTEVDDMPVKLDTVYLSSEEQPLVEARVREEMAAHDAGVGFWFSCEDGAVHMVSVLEQFSRSRRTLGTSEHGMTQEAINAVIRSWLDALLPPLQEWQQKKQNSSNAEPDDDNPLNTGVQEGSPPVPIDFEELPPRGTPATLSTYVPLADTWPKRINWETFAVATMIAPRVFLPGAAIGVVYRSDMRFAVFMEVAKLIPAEFQSDLVKLIIRKHPISMGINWLFAQKWGSWNLGGGLEIDIYQRKVFLQGEFDNQKVSAQTALFIRGGISLHLFSSVCLVFHMGARLLLTVPVYEITVVGERRMLHDPWLIQPLGGLGIRVGIF